MQVLTQITFHNQDEYTNFCEHMAKLKSIGVSKPSLDKSDVKQSGSQEVGEPQRLEPKTATSAKAEPAKTEKKADTAKKTEAKGANIPPDGERLDNEPTYENMKNAILAVSQKYKSKKPAFAILNKYGIEKITPDIEEKHYAPVIKDCQASLDVADTAAAK